LEDTPNKKELLKKAGVVDAGGSVYLMIFRNIFGYFKRTEDISSPKTFAFEDAKKLGQKRFIQILSNRYEVVALLKNVDDNEKTIKK
jgi:dihydroxyacetone kinase-like predicted kinase